MDEPDLYEVQTAASGPQGALPLTPELLEGPSGDVFGMTQNAGMGWEASKVGRDQLLILSTQGGLRADDGTPIALGYHTGHWEVGLLVREVALEIDRLGALPFAAAVSDPCDGRSQGTSGMFDSLPYRNDAALVLRRLVRSLPRRRGVIGIGTCDKGLPAMTMALASFRELAGAIVPGGVTLPPRQGEDAGAVQTLGARFAHGLVTLEDAADLGCRACASPGGGCQFLGTAATAQVVAEALGLTVPHAALAPSGQPVWLDVARRTAQAVQAQWQDGRVLGDVLTDHAIENAMLVHAAFGGSTNLLIHIPAIAHAAGLRAPHGRGLAQGQRVGAPPGRRAPERPAPPPDRARLPRRGRARGDAAPARARPAPHGRTHRGGPHARRGAGRVGRQRAAAPAARSADGGRRGRPRRRHLPAGAREREGDDLDGLLPGGEPRPGRQRDQEHRHRSACARRGRGVPADRPRPRVHERARRHRHDQGTAGRADRAGRCDRARRARPDGHGHGGDLPAHLGAQVPARRTPRRTRHRCALLGRLDGGVHRPRQPRGARGRPDRAGDRGRRRAGRRRPRRTSPPPSTSSATRTSGGRPRRGCACSPSGH